MSRLRPKLPGGARGTPDRIVSRCSFARHASCPGGARSPDGGRLRSKSLEQLSWNRRSLRVLSYVAVGSEGSSVCLSVCFCNENSVKARAKCLQASGLIASFVPFGTTQTRK